MKGFFNIEIKTPAAPPPGVASDNWESFSPGMRREIWRQYEREQKQ